MIGLPPSLVDAVHFTDMVVEDVASTAKLVGAAGTNVCVMAGKSSADKIFKVGSRPYPLRTKNCTPFKFHELLPDHMCRTRVGR